MKNKFKSHYLRLGPRRFVLGTVLLLIILDVINSFYLRAYWVSKNLSMVFVEKLAQKQGVTFDQLSQQTIMEVETMINNAFFFFLFVVLINNLFFYVFYLRKKLWAQGYILFYTFTNSILSLSFLFEGGSLGWHWFIYNLATTLAYIYLYFGVKVLKFETTDAIPVSEMKAL